MLYVKDAKNLEPNARLEDFQIIKEIAGKCGFKVRTVSAPGQKSTTESTVSTAERRIRFIFL